MVASGVNYSSADIFISVNGIDLPNGGYTKGNVDYSGANYSQFDKWSMFGHYDVPSTGVYTFAIRCILSVPQNGTAIIGGSNATVLQAGLKIEVYKP